MMFRWVLVLPESGVLAPGLPYSSSADSLWVAGFPRSSVKSKSNIFSRCNNVGAHHCPTHADTGDSHLPTQRRPRSSNANGHFLILPRVLTFDWLYRRLAVEIAICHDAVGCRRIESGMDRGTNGIRIVAIGGAVRPGNYTMKACGWCWTNSPSTSV